MGNYKLVVRRVAKELVCKNVIKKSQEDRFGNDAKKEKWRIPKVKKKRNII